MIPQIRNYESRGRGKTELMVESKLNQNLSIENIQETTVGGYRGMAANQLMQYANTASGGYRMGSNSGNTRVGA
jgi:hypothetical protein